MCAKKNVQVLISNQARELFNEQSWSSVSLRKIAAAVGMSDGNLRYHFKTKEELVLHLFSEMTAEMAVVIQNRGEDLGALSENFERMFRIMYRYRFLFVESHFIKKAYDSYAILFKQLEDSRRLLFITEFNVLKEQGVLASTFSEEQYETLFEQIFIISDSWMKYLESDADAYVDERIKHYADLCNALMIPYMK